jgi:hypothetical protein
MSLNYREKKVNPQHKHADEFDNINSTGNQERKCTKCSPSLTGNARECCGNPQNQQGNFPLTMLLGVV